MSLSVNPWLGARKAKPSPGLYWWLLIGPWALSSHISPLPFGNSKIVPALPAATASCWISASALKDEEALLLNSLSNHQQPPPTHPPTHPKCLSLTSRPLHSTLMIGYLAGWEPMTHLPIADLNLGFFSEEAQHMCRLLVFYHILTVLAGSGC